MEKEGSLQRGFFWFNSECSLMDIHIGLYTVTLKFNEKPYAKRL